MIDRRLRPYISDPGTAGPVPGLSGLDADILRRHMAAGTAPSPPYAFFLPVGSRPGEHLAEPPDEPHAGAAANWYRRIDLVALGGAVPLVCEIKPAAGYVALGQAIVYRDLARRQWPGLDRAEACVLTDCCDPDLLDCFDQARVQVRCLPGCPYEPIGRPT